MRRFIRNIKESRVWKITIAMLMTLIVISTLLPSSLSLVWSADGTEQADLLDNTSITLDSVSLTATYKDEDGNTVVTEIQAMDSVEDSVELPYDADITMNLQFVLGDGNQISADTVYTYTLPSSIRVDVDAWHDLAYVTGNQEAIGKVHIKKDGTLDFVFDTNVVTDHTNIPFYVNFSGSFSSENQQEGTSIQIEFPTTSAPYTFYIETLSTSEPEEEEEVKDIGISKSGSFVTVDGTRYIEWTVALNPNGRTNVNGDIIDNLPEGLSYVSDVNGYPYVDGAGTVAVNQDGQNVTLTLSDTGSTTSYVHFLTKIDSNGTIYQEDGKITDQWKEIKNEAIFNPADTTETSVTAATSVWSSPNMLTKSAAKSTVESDTQGYYIDWTVTVNAEQLNIAGATYTDTLGDGLTMPDVADIHISPSDGATVLVNDNGFEIGFSAVQSDTNTNTNTYTITYCTYVEDTSKNAASFKNTATFTGDKFDNFSKTVTVQGVKLLDKSIGYRDYDSITKLFTWTITVNQDELPLSNAVLTDTFDSKEMEFVEAYTLNEAGEHVELTYTGLEENLKFELGDISTKQVIYVITKMKDDFTSITQWYTFKNTTSLTTDEFSYVTDDASYTVDTQAEIPDFVSKSGSMNGDGTITWTVYVSHVTNNAIGIDFTDTLPTGMSYVEGSFTLKNSWGGDAVSRTPVYEKADTTGTLSYTLAVGDEATTDVNDSVYMDDSNGFQIVYQTKIDNAADAETEKTYTNSATVTLNFDNDISVPQTESATVKGTPGGVLDKTFTYYSGREVVWNVKINEARLTLNATNPYIEDQLADYMDYVSGILYLVNEDGTREEVDSTSYKVTTVNRKLIVMLPEDLDGKCYEFEFITSFNTSVAESLANETVNNTVSFYGLASEHTVTSDTVKNIAFSSSSAGAVINQEIRVKKVDESDPTKVLEGAVFQLIVENNGSSLVVAEATSGSDGYAVFKNLSTQDGLTYKVKEATAPSGYLLQTQIKDVVFDDTLTLQTDSNGVQYYEMVVADAPADKETTGSITVTKTNEGGSEKLAGAVFGIYSDSSCTNLLYTMLATDANGTASYAGLQPGDYYIKEITSPEGYVANDKVIMATLEQAGSYVKTTYYQKNDNTGKFDGSIDAVTFTNRKIACSLVITKYKETDGKADKATPLPGATFGLYSDKLCTDLLQSLTTDDTGKAKFTGLEYGKTYYYREDAAPSGYVKDSTIHTVTITGDSHSDVIITEEVTNHEALGNLVITKYGDDGTLLEGVEFQLYKKDSTKSDERGDAVQDASGKAITATTDKDGIATFKDVPFGEYILVESKGLDNYQVAADTEVTISQLGDTKVTVVNAKKKVTIQVYKTGTDSSDASGLQYPLAGAQFGLYTENGLRIATATTDKKGIADFGSVVLGNYYVEEIQAPAGYNKDTKKYNILKTDLSKAYDGTKTYTVDSVNVKQNGSISLTKCDEKVTDNPLQGATYTLYDSMGTVVDTIITSTDGAIKFTGLAYGTYYLQETKAPAGYSLDATRYEIQVDSDTPVTSIRTEDGVTNILKNKLEIPPYISFKIKKTDAETGVVLANATFGFYYKQEGTDTNGNAYKEVLLATAITNEQGIAYFRRVNINELKTLFYKGNTINCYIREIAAPTEYVLDTTNYYEITYTDNWAEAFVDGDAYGNNTKDDDSIYWLDSGTVTPKDNSGITNEQVKATITFRKCGVRALELLAGAEFTLYKTDGTPVEDDKGAIVVATSDKNGNVVFENVPYGSYIIRETKAPQGYTLYPNPIATDADGIVRVTSSGTITLPDVTDTRMQVYISKRATGGVTELSGATLRLVDIGDASGYSNTTIDKTLSEALAKQENVIATWTTGTSSYRIPYNKLIGGHAYILYEDAVPNGYALSDPIYFELASNGKIQNAYSIGTAGTSSAEVNGTTLIMRDAPFSLTVSKKGESATGELENAILALIDGDSGKVLEQWTTGTTAHVVDSTKLAVPTGTDYKTYIIRELSAPSGYEFAEDIVIYLDSNGNFYQDKNGSSLGTNAVVTMVDTKKADTTLYIRKADASTGSALAGSEFKIVNEGSDKLVGNDGNVLTGAMWSWTSTNTPHSINASLLQTGVNYQLIETNAPSGYTRAEPVTFQIVMDSNSKYTIQYESASADPSTVLNAAKDTFMVHDSALSLTIRKQNDFGTLVDGATLTLSEYDLDNKKVGTQLVSFETSAAMEEVIDASMLTVGQTYILQETVTPKGYQTAEDILFTVNSDTTIDIITFVESNGQTVQQTTKAVNNKVIMEDITNGIFINKKNTSGDFIAGCELELTSTNDGKFDTKTWITGDSTVGFDMADFRDGFTYVLTEKSAAVGYLIAEPITFQIAQGGTKVIVNGEEQDCKKTTSDGVEKYLLEIDMVDEAVEVNISKQDATNQKEIAGAKLEIRDADGNLVYNFTSTDQPTTIPAGIIKAGTKDAYAEYTLTEIQAPLGYEVAETVTFAVDEAGNIYSVTQNSNGEHVYKKLDDHTVTMLDEPQIQISKQNIAGDEVPGATLTITAKDAEGIQPISWVSGTEPKYFNRASFVPGVTYILTETNAPAGYAYTESIEFMVNNYGDLYVNGKKVTDRNITMVDEVLTVYISKQDITNGKELAGAKLVIKDETGREVYSFVSGNTPTLIPSEYLQAPQPGEYQYYTLTEITAPDGYDVAETIYFALDSDGRIYIRNEQNQYVQLTNQMVVMQDQPNSSLSTEDASNVQGFPKTGDRIPLYLMILLGLVSLFGGCILLNHRLFGTK